jgi:hypothetical protein
MGEEHRPRLAPHPASPHRPAFIKETTTIKETNHLDCQSGRVLVSSLARPSGNIDPYGSALPSCFHSTGIAIANSDAGSNHFAGLIGHKSVDWAATDKLKMRQKQRPRKNHTKPSPFKF